MLTDCPRKLFRGSEWQRITELIEFADAARHGTWPVAGGVLDQTVHARRLFRLIWQHTDLHRPTLF